MEVSRLTFREETKKAMKSGLSSRALGELRWKRLKELEADGTLSLVKNRKELATAVGFGEQEMVKGTTWVFRMKRAGHLAETLLGFNDNTRTPEYEYHTTGNEPNFRAGRIKKDAKKNVEKELRRWQDKVEAGQIPEAPQPVLDTPTEPEVTVLASPVKLELIKGDVCIKVELGNSKDTGELIKTIFNGA